MVSANGAASVALKGVLAMTVGTGVIVPIAAAIAVGGVVAGVVNTVRLVKAWKDFSSAFSNPPSKPLDLTKATKLLNVPDTQLVAKAREDLGIDVVDHFNFAFLGSSGVGKSNLINALRCTQDDEPGAAPVGETETTTASERNIGDSGAAPVGETETTTALTSGITAQGAAPVGETETTTALTSGVRAQGAAPVGETETTTAVKRYPDPEYPHVVYWDFPGCGTRKKSADTYFEDYKLYAFDGILLISADRFLTSDQDIAKKAEQCGIICTFVRTKGDTAVASKTRRSKRQITEACKDLKQEVTQKVKGSLGNLWTILKSQVFCGSPTAFLDAAAVQFQSDASAMVEAGKAEEAKMVKSLVEAAGKMDETKMVNYLIESSRFRRSESPS